METIAILEKFGLPTAFLGFMIWLFVRSDDKFREERTEHRIERKEWRESSERLHIETNRALEELTRAIRRDND